MLYTSVLSLMTFHIYETSGIRDSQCDYDIRCGFVCLAAGADDSSGTEAVLGV